MVQGLHGRIVPGMFLFGVVFFLGVINESASSAMALDCAPSETGGGQLCAAQAISNEAIGRQMQRGAGFTVEGFFEEVRKGNAENVKMFIRSGMDVNAKDKDGISALYVASGAGHLEIARLLLDAGAVIDAPSPSDCSTPLHEAVSEKRKEVARFLIERGGCEQEKLV